MLLYVVSGLSTVLTFFVGVALIAVDDEVFLVVIIGSNDGGIIQDKANRRYVVQKIVRVAAFFLHFLDRPIHVPHDIYHRPGGRWTYKNSTHLSS